MKASQFSDAQKAFILKQGVGFHAELSRFWSEPLGLAQGVAENRNPHSSTLVDRGFLPRRLSYASRHPKLFTTADRQLRVSDLK